MPAPVAETFSVNDSVAAMARLEGGGLLGKVALDVGW